MSRTIIVKVPLSDQDSNSRNSLEAMIENLKSIKKSVCFLRDANLDHERIRDQYIIHLQQCQEDHGILRQIYKNLKLKLDHANNELNEGEELAGVVQGGELPSSIPTVATNTIPTIEYIKKDPIIQQLAENVPLRNIRIRSAISTSTAINTIQFSSNGSKIAFSDQNYIYLMQSDDGEILARIDLNITPESSETQHCIRFSPDDVYLAVGIGKAVQLYDLTNLKKVNLVRSFTGHKGNVTAMVFKYDNSWLVTGSSDSVLKVYDMKTYNSVLTRNHDVPGDISIVAISAPSDSSFYTVGFSHGMVGIYSEKFEQPMVNFSAHSNILRSLAVSPLDDTIATASEDRVVKVWTMRGVASCKHTLTDHTDAVTSTAFCPSAHILFTGSRDKTIRIWQHKTGTALYVVNAHSDQINQLSHHPSENVFASCGNDGVVCIWEYDTK